MNPSTVSERHPALTDEQTGLPNRRHFDTVFETLFAMARRGMPLAILLLEVEGSESHDEGPDEGRIFRYIANTIDPSIRQTDLFARVDEGRFVLGLVDCNLAGAAVVAHRIDGFLGLFREGTGLGFSIGGAAYDRGFESLAELFEAAERALEVARGRRSNRVEFHQPEP
jgi:diguanylate cyclase (GGDEF)-like protein